MNDCGRGYAVQGRAWEEKTQLDLHHLRSVQTYRSRYPLPTNLFGNRDLGLSLAADAFVDAWECPIGFCAQTHPLPLLKKSARPVADVARERGVVVWRLMLESLRFRMQNYGIDMRRIRPKKK